jgi:hypothetical protein
VSRRGLVITVAVALAGGGVGWLLGQQFGRPPQPQKVQAEVTNRLDGLLNAGFTEWLRKHDPELISSIKSSSLFAYAVSGLTLIDLPKGVRYARGDVLVSEDELAAAIIATQFRRKSGEERPTLDWDRQPTPDLANLLVSWNKHLRAVGNVVLWDVRARLKYVVATSSFPSTTKAAAVKAAIETAAAAWYDASGVRWDCATDLESRVGAGWAVDPLFVDVEFVVRYVEQAPGLRGEYAFAFFPASLRSEHEILITPAFFLQTDYTPHGLLTHELGHVMGFVDERGRSSGGLTPVDPQSVMFLPTDPSIPRPINLRFDRLDETTIGAIYPK